MLVTWMVKDKIHIANSMPEVIISMLSKHDWINVFFFRRYVWLGCFDFKNKGFLTGSKTKCRHLHNPPSLFLSLSLIFTCNTCTWTRIKVISLLPATNRHPDNLSYLKNNTCSARMMYENIIISVLLIK